MKYEIDGDSFDAGVLTILPETSEDNLELRKIAGKFSEQIDVRTQTLTLYLSDASKCETCSKNKDLVECLEKNDLNTVNDIEALVKDVDTFSNAQAELDTLKSDIRKLIDPEE